MSAFREKAREERRQETSNACRKWSIFQSTTHFLRRKLMNLSSLVPRRTAALCCVTLGGMIAVMSTLLPVVPTPMAVAGTGGAIISTVRAGSGYDVYVNSVLRAHVPLREPSSSIVTAVTGDGSRAVVIPDHDTTQGTGLLVLDVASGKLRTLVEGPVTSAAFS